MRLTITHALLHATFVGLISSTAAAQATDTIPSDPFQPNRWHAEIATEAALEAWNYNGSHEELYGLKEGLTYGLRDGVVLTITQHAVYVSQRAQDAWVLALTGGVRGRVYRHGAVSVFLEGAVGVSDTAIAAPPRGTRFNYLALGGGGAIIRLRPRLHLTAALQWIHLSNNSLKGPGRNPDIEAIGPSIGILLGF